jgi:hypothetical protein
MPLPPPFPFSQSSLQDYNDCPRRFNLRYVEHLAWPGVESLPALENEKHQLEGQQFHRLAQQALIGIAPEKLTRHAASPNLARWWESFSVNFLPIEAKDLGGARLLPETSLSAPLGEHRLTAKFDLIAIADGKFTIYDWKTSLKLPKPAHMQARLQTRVYRYLLASAGAHLNGGAPIPPERIEMIYWYPEFPAQPIRLPYEADQFARDRAGLAKLTSEIAAASEFPATEDEQACRFCNYRTFCERKIAPGDWRDAEDEPSITIESIDAIEI